MIYSVFLCHSNIHSGYFPRRIPFCGITFNWYNVNYGVKRRICYVYASGRYDVLLWGDVKLLFFFISFSLPSLFTSDSDVINLWRIPMHFIADPAGSAIKCIGIDQLQAAQVSQPVRNSRLWDSLWISTSDCLSPFSSIFQRCRIASAILLRSTILGSSTSTANTDNAGTVLV